MASNALRIDADDFLSPGLECIKEPDTTPEGKKIEISLDDCLACSGCITSAEEIMLQQHNIDEIIKVLDNKKNKANLIVSIGISSQSLASLCVKNNIDQTDVIESYRKVTRQLLKQSGIDYIFDYTWATAVALESTFEYFVSEEENNQIKKPILCSACPGWVVYAEKTYNDLVVPHLSKTKSPQQILGRHLKSKFDSEKNQFMYHISVAPCFDRKLEAARKANRIKLKTGNLSDDLDPEVDVVISTEEFELLIEKLQQRQADKEEDQDEDNELMRRLSLENSNSNLFDNLSEILPEIDENQLKNLEITNDNDLEFLGSDSYLNYIYHRLQVKHGLETTKLKFEKYRGKNKDFNITELKIPSEGNAKTYKFATVYGFKSIQQLIRMFKTKKAQKEFDYIEVMACPSGCLNGGGQIKYKGISRDDQNLKFLEVEKMFLKLGLLSWSDGFIGHSKLNKENHLTSFFDKKELEKNNNSATTQNNAANLIQLGANW